MNRLTVGFDGRLEEELDNFSENTGFNKSEIVRTALFEYLKSEGVEFDGGAE